MSENSSYESVEGTQIKMITENTEVDLAIFYDDIYEQTILEVIPLGHAETGAETMANEAGTVRLELVTFYLPKQCIRSRE